MTKEEIKKEGGNLPMFEPFYFESIKYEAERAISAFDRFDNTIKNKDDSYLVVANIQEALTHVGSLSKYFFPPRDNGVSLERAKKLRTIFKVSDDSPLSNRNLRDALEHFDERLDLYLAKFPIGQLITTPIIAPISSLVTPLRVFRLVDPVSSTFVILDEKYEFGSLREATKEILSKV